MRTGGLWAFQATIFSVTHDMDEGRGWEEAPFHAFVRLKPSSINSWAILLWQLSERVPLPLKESAVRRNLKRLLWSPRFTK